MVVLFSVLLCVVCVALCAPVQLVSPDDTHSQLVIQKGGIEVLRKFSTGFGVISVIGPLHSGKSFLLNQLRGKMRGFELGQTVHPKTKGLWIWDELLQDEKGKKFVLLDTEGFYASNVTSVYDAKVFSIATLMSSMVVYNSIRSIDMGSLEALELLGRRAELFLFRSQRARENKTEEEQQELDIAMPDLHWVVRDFYQKIDSTCTQWLRNLLKSSRRDDAGPHLSDSLTLEELFPSLECSLLGFPSLDEKTLVQLDQSDKLASKFESDVKELKAALFRKLKPKKLGSKEASGEMLAQFLKSMVDRANSGTFPLIASPWSTFVKEQIGEANEWSARTFQAKAGKIPLSSVEAFAKELKDLRSSVLHSFEEALRGLADLEPVKHELHHRLTEIENPLVERNHFRISTFVSSVVSEMLQEADRKFKQIRLPVPQDEFQIRTKKIVSGEIELFNSKTSPYSSSKSTVSKALQEMVKSLEEKKSKVELNNNLLIESLLSANVTSAVENFKSCCVITFPPQEEAVFQKFVANCTRASVTMFESKTSALSKEKLFGVFSRDMKSTISSLELERHESHMHAVADYCQDEAQNMIVKYDQWRSKLLSQLPMATEELEQSELIEYRKFEKILHGKIARYSQKPVSAAFDKLKKSRERILQELHAENVERVKKRVGRFLDEIRGVAARVSYEYRWQPWGLQKHIRGVAQNLLRNQITSSKLREQVINDFIKNNISWSHWSSIIVTLVVATIGAAILLFIVFGKPGRTELLIRVFVISYHNRTLEVVLGNGQRVFTLTVDQHNKYGGKLLLHQQAYINIRVSGEVFISVE